MNIYNMFTLKNIIYETLFEEALVKEGRKCYC